MATQRSHTIEVTGGSQISLGDLRWLVDQLKTASDDHAISVSFTSGTGNFERDESRLSTTVPDVSAKTKTPVYRDGGQTFPTPRDGKWTLTDTQYKYTSNGVHVQPVESQDER